MNACGRRMPAIVAVFATGRVFVSKIGICSHFLLARRKCRSVCGQLSETTFQRKTHAIRSVSECFGVFRSGATVTQRETAANEIRYFSQYF